MEHNDRSPAITRQHGSSSQGQNTAPLQSEARTFQYTPAKKNCVFLVLLALYVTLFIVIGRVTASGMAAISALVLVIAAGWRFGALAGIAAGVLSLPCNILLFAALGVDWLQTLFAHGAGLAGTAGLMFIGGIIGFMHNLRTQLLTELAERRRAEQELTRHRDRLNDLVQQRTAELEAANKRLLEEAEERREALNELSTTKEYLENVIGTSLDSIVIVDQNGVITRVNKALLDLSGRTKDELIGKPFNHIFAIEQGLHTTTAGETIEAGPAFIADAKDMNVRLFKQGKISNWEYYLVGKDGKLIPVEQNIILLTDTQGQGVGAVGILRDITHRRRAENELRRHRDHLNDLVQEKTRELSEVNKKLAASNRRLLDSELLLKEAQHIARLGSWEWNVQAGEAYWSDEFYRLLGYEPGQVKPRFDLFAEHLHPDDRELFFASRRDFDLANPFQEGEFRIITKSGATRHISSQVRADCDEAGNAVRMYGTLQDITERKHAENELKKREVVLKDAQALAHVGNWERELYADTNYWSDEYYRILGYEPGEIEPTLENFFSHIHPEDQEKFLGQHMTGDIVDLEFRIVQKSGKERFVTALAKVDMNPAGMPERVHGVLVDITERKRAEETLRESEERFRALAETSPDAIFTGDENMTIVFWNAAAEKIFGYTQEEIVGRRADILIPKNRMEHHAANIERILKMDQPQAFRSHLETTACRKGGTEFPVDVSVTSWQLHDRTYFSTVLRDITERKRAENELLRYQNELEELVKERTAELEAAQRELVTKEKLSVLGRLTATVSHELRNPLGVIRSSIFYLQKKIQDPDEKTGKHLNRIEEQISICDGIVDELLEYTRGRQSEMVPGDVNSLLGEIRSLIYPPNGVQLDWSAARGLPPVGFDRDKMKRVFINLVQNAIQAVTAKKEKDPAYDPCIAVAATAGDGGVCIEVRDNGIGMSEETVAHAFEPLFTTHARGTGLGLSIVQKIVHEHNGTVRLESLPGQGTTVTVCLPAQPS
jgi:PAS domain S-box-containing protein